MTSDLGALPTRFGRYEVLGLIGSGSFADVLRAWDEALASHVAIKVLNAEASANELARDRFVEEGKLLRRVHSPNVLGVHDLGELDDGRPYLVVDLAEGGTLDDRIDPLDGQPIDADSVRRIADALASGLEAMHAAGVIHRDIKPENLLIDSSRSELAPSTEADTMLGGVFDVNERLVIGDLGLAKDLSSRGSSPSVIGGSARYQAPEQLRADGVLGPPTDLYAASSVLWRLLTGEVAPEPHDVADDLTVFRPGWQGFFQRAMAIDPDERFASAAAWRSAVLDQLELEPLAVADGDRVLAMSRACPYKGLAAFQPEDADVFFGREDLVDELLRRLQANRVLVVAGPSGSGKSSAVRAGLLPALRTGALPGSDQWHYELFTPGAEPFEELHYRLTRTIDGRPPLSAAQLAADPRQARRLLDQAASPDGDQGAGKAWLIHIDQFEEVFTQPDDPEVAKAFVEALSAMVDPIDSRLRLVLAVRADFYSRCAQVSWLAQRITENQVLVGPMSTENMRRAIEEPARRHGLRFEPGLVEAVLDEGGRSAGSLPLISHAMVETWARRDGNVLTVQGFRDAGGVGGAIAQSADTLFEVTFDDAQQRAAKRLLLRLITPGEGTADTRRRLPFDELERDGEPEVMASVVSEFVSARLLAVDDKTVEIAHEALIGGWPRLRDWIDGERANLRFRHRIGRAATEWETSDRDPDLLWRGTPLATALDWAADHGHSLDRLERDFIDSSEAARVAEESRRAERQARSQRNRRRATAALAALTLASVLASIVAFVAFRRADNSTQVAERQFANALGTSALGQARTDPRQALLLAMESRERTDPPPVDARAAMVQARLALTEPGVVPFGPPVATPGSFKVALRPDGAVAAVADPTGPIRLYDVATGEQVGDDLERHTRGARTLTFTSDGSTLISGASDNLVLRWDLGDLAVVGPPTVISDTPDVIAWSVAVDPDDRLLAVAGDDGTVSLYDLDDLGTGEPREVLPWNDRSGGVTVVAFSPDGSKLVASNRSGRVNGWRTDTFEGLWDPMTTPTGAKVWEIVFHPDGTRFATAGDGPSALIHDADTGQPIAGLVFGGRDDTDTTIRGVAFSGDGTRLIGGSSAGTVHTWSVADPDRDPTVSWERHSDAVEHGDLSADGTVYATVGDDKVLRLWRSGAVPVADLYDGFPRGAYGAAFDPAGTRIAVGDGRGRLHLVSLDGGGTSVSTDGHDGPLWDIVWSPDGTWLASIGDDGQVLRWDPSTATVEASIGRHRGEGRSLSLSPDGRYLVSADRGEAGEGADVNVWATETGSLHEQLMPHEQGVRATAFSPDGRLLATADGLGDIRVWNTESFALVRQWSTSNTIWALSFNEFGMLASVDSGEDVRVFDSATGEQVGITVSGIGTNGGTGVGFSADGQTLAVVTRAGQLYFIDWQQGVNLAPTAVDGHPGEEVDSFELAFDVDLVRFATTATDGTVRIWDVLSTSRACDEAASRLDPSIEADLFDGATPVACAQP